MDKADAFYLIDAYALIYRSYFAFISRPLRNKDGKNMSALFGFARTLLTLLEGNGGGIRFLAAVFDSRTPTFRHKQYPQYKAQRQKAPDDLHAQVPLVEEFLCALKIPVLKVDGFEADDVIATLVERLPAGKHPCYIVSSDKDLLQLVSDDIIQLRPAKTTAVGTASRYNQLTKLRYEAVGRDEVCAEWGVPPEKILDLLSLTGDSSDNVPGVRGIGDKIAVKLLTRYGSLDEIYKNIASINGALAKKLAESKDNAYLSRDLITLCRDVPLPINGMSDLNIENLDRAAGAAILIRESIPSLAKELLNGSRRNPEAADAAPDFSGNVAAGKNGVLYTGKDGVYVPCEPVGSYRLILALSELEGILAEARGQGYFVLNFETDANNVWHSKLVGLSIAVKVREAVYVPLAPHGPASTERDKRCLPQDEVFALLKPLLGDSSVTVIAHNAKFAYEVSRAWGIPRWNCSVYDTMIAAWLCVPERSSYALSALARDHLGYDAVAYFSIVPKGALFHETPLETACRYSAEVADLCLRMKPLMDEKMNETGSLSLFYALEMPLVPILAEMEGTGIMIESSALRTYGKELGADIERTQAETWNIVGHKFNLASPMQLQDVLFKERGLKPGKKTKTGFSTDVAVLAELARSDPVPGLILRHRALSKLKSTYVDVLPAIADGKGRVHTSFIQSGTATGRLSSRDPNLQNIPIRDEEGRRIREAFVASPGMTLISADYSQIELVVLAHLSKDQALTSAFNAGKDIHAETAAKIFGIAEGAVDAAQRRIAKVINFGVMYGMSAFRLSDELGISRTEAHSFIDAYFKTYSGVRALLSSIVEGAEKNGYVTTLFGRRRSIPTINSPNRTEKSAAQRIAVNTPIQGTAADIVKRAMIDVDRALTGLNGNRPEDKRWRMLLQVHDELILEGPEAEAEATARLVRDVMEKAADLAVPLRVSVETGKRWGDFH
ncbi:MAG: DNA polymerase I [Spirochaetaceae bacterium]|jgi:DNA polymerase-1|nr:DNA polymerase I [Spirochaetaceae bacterium]